MFVILYYCLLFIILWKLIKNLTLRYQNIFLFLIKLHFIFIEQFKLGTYFILEISFLSLVYLLNNSYLQLQQRSDEHIVIEIRTKKPLVSTFFCIINIENLEIYHQNIIQSFIFLNQFISIKIIKLLMINNLPLNFIFYVKYITYLRLIDLIFFH